MACFLVPTAEAIVMTVVRKAAGSKNEIGGQAAIKHGDHFHAADSAAKIPFTRKLKWLTNMLWGGSALLAFEHVWHGEVTPWFPFLTAAGDPEEAAIMLREMATSGVAMAVLVTAVWLIILGVVKTYEKRPSIAQSAQEV
ncbi:MAG: hypothetical protein LBD85_04765 [Oscillospiraceae bacterium]|jgi:hypothetical protein|nr:hypothetical protein [Oscillospiraceae bacterium]